MGAHEWKPEGEGGGEVGEVREGVRLTHAWLDSAEV